MRKRHTAKQIIKKLREADAMLASGKTIGLVCQALGIGESTFYKWQNKYGGIKAQERSVQKDCNGESLVLSCNGRNPKVGRPAHDHTYFATK